MAKGWESKSVEEQQSLASQTPLTDEDRQRITKDRADKMRTLQALNLSRARVVELLERSTNERYKQMLHTELTHLESEIKKLS
jgi:hypothetical protein